MYIGDANLAGVTYESRTRPPRARSHIGAEVGERGRSNDPREPGDYRVVEQIPQPITTSATLACRDNGSVQ
jgi:hypothetical protein